MVLDIGYEQGAVLPRYGSYCLTGVPATILSLFGIRSDRPKLPDDAFEGIDTTGVENVVVFVFDGFGYAEWKRQQSAGFVRLMAERGRVTSITSVFPSTTSTALTTIATGATPQEHGLIEWFMYLSDLDMIIETLPFSPMGAPRGDQLRPSVDPRILFDGETIFSRMIREGVEVQSVLPRGIAQSGYSSVVHEGTNIIPYSRASDLVTSLRKRLEGSSRPAFFYVYWPGVDTIEHVYGPSTEETRLEAAMISYLILEGLATKMEGPVAGRTLFLATADHGQIRSPTSEAVMLDDYDKLVDSFATSSAGKKILPWGGTRDVYLQVKDELLEDTRTYLSEILEGRAKVFRTSDVIDSGLFGTGVPSERFGSRVGNLMILPSGTRSVWYRHPNVERHEMQGVHGGLHEDEMTVPFAAMRGSSVR